MTHGIEVDEKLKPIECKLNDILSRAHHADRRLSAEEVLHLQEELHEVDEHYQQALFDGVRDGHGHALLAGKLNDAHNAVRKLQLHAHD